MKEAIQLGHHLEEDDDDDDEENDLVEENTERNSHHAAPVPVLSTSGAAAGTGTSSCGLKNYGTDSSRTGGQDDDELDMEL